MICHARDRASMGFYAWKCFKFENNLPLSFPGLGRFNLRGRGARWQPIAPFKFPWRTIWVLTSTNLPCSVPARIPPISRVDAKSWLIRLNTSAPNVCKTTHRFRRLTKKQGTFLKRLSDLFFTAQPVLTGGFPYRVGEVVYSKACRLTPPSVCRSHRGLLFSGPPIR